MSTESSSRGEVEAQEQAWRDVIIEHNQFPRCLESIDNPSHQGAGENPYCGDQVRLSLSVSPTGIIEAAGIEIKGCAISTASASLMASQLQGMHIDQARKLFARIHALLTAANGQPAETGGELDALRLVRNYPLRVKCASLAWHVLNSTLNGPGETVSTE